MLAGFIRSVLTSGLHAAGNGSHRLMLRGTCELCDSRDARRALGRQSKLAADAVSLRRRARVWISDAHWTLGQPH